MVISVREILSSPSNCWAAGDSLTSVDIDMRQDQAGFGVQRVHQLSCFAIGEVASPPSDEGHFSIERGWSSTLRKRRYRTEQHDPAAWSAAWGSASRAGGASPWPGWRRPAVWSFAALPA